jgi:hypothetical protein
VGALADADAVAFAPDAASVRRSSKPTVPNRLMARLVGALASLVD